MRGFLFAAVAFGAAAAAHAAPVTRIAAAPPRAGWFVCDAVAGPYAAFAGEVTNGKSVITLLDRRTGAFDTQSYDVGPADHGAGNVYWPLSQHGHDVGTVHGINPGMVAGSDGIAPIKQVTIGGKALDCRWLGAMRFIGLDSRRGVVVREEGGTLVYRSFDFAGRGKTIEMDEGQTSNAPTLMLTGGQATATGYRFANKGYVYTVEWPTGAGAGAIVVRRGGRIVGTDRLVGSSSSDPATAKTALGPDAVWDGRGLDACRRNEDQASLRACVADRMKAAGVSAAGIAFAARADDGLGYVSGWRQAGPVGIATVTYPFRANTNEGTALIPQDGAPIFVDAYPLTATDKARPDYRAAMKAHPDAWPVAPGEVAAPKIAAGQPLTIRVRTRMATCHACEPTGAMIVAYRFDAAGRATGAAVERVE